MDWTRKIRFSEYQMVGILREVGSRWGQECMQKHGADLRWKLRGSAAATGMECRTNVFKRSCKVRERTEAWLADYASSHRTMHFATWQIPTERSHSEASKTYKKTARECAITALGGGVRCKE